MKIEDMIMISVDDHFIEPPTMFDRHTPANLKGKMPHVIEKNGFQAWVFEDRVIPNLALNAVVGRRPEEYGFEPTSLSQIRKGCWDVNERIRDMNANGQLAGANFASWPGVSGLVFLKAKDKSYALQVLQAHNDWNIDEWCGTAPERFIPIALLPVWSPEECAKEIKRLKAKGCNAIQLPPNGIPDGLPSWYDSYWDPIFKACCDYDMVVNMHISDASTAVPSPESAVDAFVSMMGVSLYQTAVDLVFSPVLRKFPQLKIALSEGGAGWAPNAMERMDYIYKKHHCWTRQDMGEGRLPSDLFRQHFYLCIVDDPTGIKLRHEIGIDKIMWENDYPHAETTWPQSPEMLYPTLKDIPDEDIDKITHLNAMKLFNFEPFKIRPREKCTVGALRAEARDVDVGYLPTAGIPPKRGEGIVALKDVMGQLGEAYSLNIVGAK
jgi:predicted TIM-barrel fold metal-dependent hydrolase